MVYHRKNRRPKSIIVLIWVFVISLAIDFSIGSWLEENFLLQIYLTTKYWSDNPESWVNGFRIFLDACDAIAFFDGIFLLGYEIRRWFVGKMHKHVPK
jgi:hypothetical protein